jgi:hypothetical protein
MHALPRFAITGEAGAKVRPYEYEARLVPVARTAGNGSEKALRFSPCVRDYDKRKAPRA